MRKLRINEENNKRIITIVWIIFILLFLIACNSNNIKENDPIASENENKQYSNDIANNSQIDSGYESKNFDELYKELFGIEPKEYDKKQNYSNLEEMYSSIVFSERSLDTSYYYLLYLDYDEIPELLKFETRYEGNYIWSFEKQEEYCEIRGKIYYVEKKGLIINIKENDYQNLQYIFGYSYNDGEITKEFEYEFCNNGEYAFCGGKLDEKTYNEINQKIDGNKLTSLDECNCYSKEEILFAIKTGHDSSYSHKYEIFIENLSWDEAKNSCIEKGGYLAVINSEEESRRLRDYIVKSNLTEHALYIGCKNIYWSLKNGTNQEYTSGNIFINSLNYDYMDITGGNPKSDEMDYGMVYIRNDGQSLNNNLMDIFLGPANLAEYNPKMSGKIGYICEYDK